MSLTHQQQKELVGLLENLNVEMFKDIGFEYGIDVANLGASGPKAMARELVLYAVRRIEVPKLLAAIHAIVPNMDLMPFGGEGPAVPPTTDQPEVDRDEEKEATAVPLGQLENFDIRVGRKGADGLYPVEVGDNPNKTEMYNPEFQTFPVDDYDFTDLIDYLERRVAREQDAKTLGSKMRELLFPNEIWNIFYANLTRMKREGKGLRIRLRIDAPELSKWPWEYCYFNHPDFGFFALDSDMPIVRYLPGTFESQDLTVPDPLKVLVVVSEPSDQKKLKVDKEVELIEQILNLMGQRVELQILREATFERVQGALADQPHIFHFIGHGAIRDGEGALILMDKFGQSDYRDAEQLQVLLKNRGVKVAVLNACKSAAHNAHNAFSGLAPALITAQIPAVIAMQFNVPDSTAISFTLNLYRFLVSGYPLDTAVTEMRKGAFNKDKYRWGIPVLYMRAPDGVLWKPDPELLKLFDQAQEKISDIGVDSLADLLGEIAAEVTKLQNSGKLEERDARYIKRGLADAQELLKQETVDQSMIQKELERVIEDLNLSGTAEAIEQVVPKVKHVLLLIEKEQDG